MAGTNKPSSCFERFRISRKSPRISSLATIKSAGPACNLCKARYTSQHRRQAGGRATQGKGAVMSRVSFRKFFCADNFLLQAAGALVALRMS